MNKKLIRIIALALCGILLLGLLPTVFADENGISIGSAEEFLAFAESCRKDSYSVGMTVSLTADIDLTGTDFEPVPIFAGTFKGNGYTVSGLSVTGDGSYQGLFRYLTETALVENLNVSGTVEPEGSRSYVGGIAGSNAGRIENCTFSGDVAGAEYVGGIAGVNTASGVISGCTVSGTVHGVHFAGGITGENRGSIALCVNTAGVNTTELQNTVDISDITLGSLTDAESSLTITDLGGIAGTSSGIISGCENRGDVGYKFMGYNLGGIAGSQSGYTVDCVNYGRIYGRKDVGGIVGQLSPTLLLEYSTDALQMLEAELAVLSDLLERLTLNMENNTATVNGLINTLQNYVNNIESAMNSLKVDKDNIQLPELETYRNAYKTLTTSVDGIINTVRSLRSAVENTGKDMERDLEAVLDQMENVKTVLDGASENLGGSYSDVSDADTAEDTTSEVENCVNFGSILADMNVGGIVGAMSVENDLDPEDDVELSGSGSLNIAGKLRGVVRGCVSSGTVTAKKLNAGGIAGLQMFGLVRECVSTCVLDSSAAYYVGGVVGRSEGYLRQCSAKCVLEGDRYVGGIAGAGKVVTDCRNMAWITANEKYGIVLGGAVENNTAEEYPISGNYYAYTRRDIGAIDGISYAGIAESLELQEFLALPELADIFGTVTLTFVFADGTRTAVSVAPGELLSGDSIPAIPEQTGYTAAWEGLEEVMGTEVVFDHVFTAVYTACNSVIESGAVRENGMPVFLLEGSFPVGTVLEAEPWTDVPVVVSGATMSEVWKFTLPEGTTAAKARFLLPEGSDVEKLRLQVYGAEGWREASFQQKGSYIVFDLTEGDCGVTLIQTAGSNLQWYLIAAAAVLAVTVAAVVTVRAAGKKTVKTEEEAYRESDPC